MKVNTLQRYGLRAMIEIALDEGQHGVFQKNIASRQKISLRYLDRIISGLKTAGLIRNKAGRRSGYVLARPASEITALNILNAFQADVQIVDCVNPDVECSLKEICVANSFWEELNICIKDYLKSISLQKLIDQKKRLDTKAEA